MFRKIIWRIFVWKKRRKLDRLKHLRGIKVYTVSGMEIGKVKEVYLKGYKVDSLKIKLKKEHKKSGIYLSYRCVKNARDIMIVDERVLEKIIQRTN